MSTRSYVGVLQADGRTHRVRHTHFDGGPGTMPYLIAGRLVAHLRRRRRRHRGGAAGT